MEPEYTNREIDNYHKNIQDKLDQILTQVLKTNGRVSKLELWKSYLVGAWAIMTLFVIPAFVYIYVQDKQIQHEQLSEVRNILK